jgi:hypothetical protein
MKSTLLLATLLGLWLSPATAADSRHPDWPCVQAKVAEISLPAVWSGPSIDDIGRKWEENATVRELVLRLAQRRTPLEEAEKTIAEFVAGADREEKGKLLFAGLYERLNRDRGDIVHGLERLARRQQEFAERIRADTAQLRALHDAPQREQAKVDDLTNQIEWSTRIFEDRRKTVRYACEVPIQIERRLFALARAIQQALE